MKIIRKHFHEIGSTNSWSKENFASFNQNAITLVTADQQTQGRGRFNRRWDSPAGLNIYATFNFTININQNPGNLAQILALSACEVIENLALKPTLKWPNDLLLSQKKAGGILCETFSFEDKLAIILGIGLNVNMPKNLLSLIDQTATSLKEEAGHSFEVESILESLKVNFSKNLALFLSHGLSPFLEKYNHYLKDAFGKKMSFLQKNKKEEGICHSINDDGSLNVCMANGDIVRLFSGEAFFTY